MDHKTEHESWEPVALLALVIMAIASGLPWPGWSIRVFAVGFALLIVAVVGR